MNKLCNILFWHLVTTLDNFETSDMISASSLNRLSTIPEKMQHNHPAVRSQVDWKSRSHGPPNKPEEWTIQWFFGGNHLTLPSFTYLYMNIAKFLQCLSFNLPFGPNISTYRKELPSNTGTPLHHAWMVCEESIRAIVVDLGAIPLLQATMTTRSIPKFVQNVYRGKQGSILICIDLHFPTAGRRIIPADPFSEQNGDLLVEQILPGDMNFSGFRQVLLSWLLAIRYNFSISTYSCGMWSGKIVSAEFCR